MQTYELRKNRRVTQLRGKGAAPKCRRMPRTMRFSLHVRCAADHPHRIVKLEDLQLDLLQRHLYADMKPVNLFSGEFEVAEGFEQQFREIAREHGFNACEVIVC